MPIHVVRLGSPRRRGEGPRLGTVRRPPRGVKKADYSRRDYFDVWLPDLAPSAALMAWVKSAPITPGRWRTFARRYRREMKSAAAARLIDLLAALSRRTDFSVGCYCEDESRCHRSLLRALLAEAAGVMAVAARDPRAAQMPGGG
jgi:uncharacterized protein YeaO (DUF488 family)